MTSCRAFLRPTGVVAAFITVTFSVLLLWAVYRVITFDASFARPGHPFAMVFLATFVLLVLQMLGSYAERPFRVTDEQAAELDRLNLVVSVPVYNEDPAALHRGLVSLLRQSRRPQVIHVVDDGSTSGSYDEVRQWFLVAAAEAGIEGRWVRQPNGGKRRAQSRVFAESPEADIFLTVDSDGWLDEHAIEEGLKPFVDPRVTSVAGLVLASNNRDTLISRITDLYFVTNQLTDRSSASCLGSVVVNSGPLALYRASIVRRYLDAYQHETFFGRVVQFSDDSLLTTYAIMNGRTVQQPTAVVFSLMPTTVHHHLRQYLRWMRGSFIRSFWRFRYLPFDRPAYWIHFSKWLQSVLGMLLVVGLVGVRVVTEPVTVPMLLIIPLCIGFLQSLRYLQVGRSDEGIGSQLVTLALSPLATLWAFFVLRSVRWYGMATCRRTGWGTRRTVEVVLAEPLFMDTGARDVGARDPGVLDTGEPVPSTRCSADLQPEDGGLLSPDAPRQEEAVLLG